MSQIVVMTAELGNRSSTGVKANVPVTAGKDTAGHACERDVGGLGYRCISPLTDSACVNVPTR